MAGTFTMKRGKDDKFELGQVDEFELVNKLFSDRLKAATTRAELDSAKAWYERELVSLRDRGVIAQDQYLAHSRGVPIVVDLAWAEKTGEVGPGAKTTAQWIQERAVQETAAETPGMLEVIANLPRDISAAVKTVAKETVKFIEKPFGIPASALIIGGGVLALLVAAGFVVTAVRKAKEEIVPI